MIRKSEQQKRALEYNEPETFGERISDMYWIANPAYEQTYKMKVDRNFLGFIPTANAILVVLCLLWSIGHES